VSVRRRTLSEVPHALIRLLSVLVLVLLASGCAGSGSNDDTGEQTQSEQPELERLLEQVGSAGAPGATAIVAGRSGIWRGAIGNAVLKPLRPMRFEDRIRVASITKSFVATVVLQLVNEGRLSLDDTVDQRLPGLLRLGSQITVRQLLNHTSGFATGDDSPDAEALYRQHLANPEHFHVPVRRMIALANGRPLHFEPGTNFHYTNTGYDVLGLIVERVTDGSLEAALTERIFEPLNLRHTSFEPTALQSDRGLAHGYAIEGSDLPASSDVTRAGLFGRWASAGSVSNAEDVATFYSALFGGRLLPQRLLNEMQRTVPTRSPFVQAGFGIFRYKLPCGGYAWGNGGSTHGYSTVALTSTDGTHTVVVGANAFASGYFYEQVEKTARDLYCHA
jgi:D-alanyl-D-alanine carboxypeptidase